MKGSLRLTLLLAVASIVTATRMTPLAATAAAKKDAAPPKKAPCAVCSVREGHGAEKVVASAEYEGKTYYFCSTKCRDEFQNNPKEFLEANTPRPAPGFSLKNLTGQSVDLGDYKGKVVLLDFWATWCAPCVAAMPQLQKLHDKYGDKGFTVVGIAIDEKGAETVGPLVAKKKVKYPILLGTETAWTAYRVKALPALFLVDRQGQIVRQFGGGTEHRMIEQAVREVVTP